jgi:magnesium transporter
MTDVVASLKPTSTLREASAKFTRYGFRAIPVVDDDTGKILGVVPYRDMMNLKHRFPE